jgi:hypothetical protein
MYKGSLLSLLDLKLEKILQFSHHRHLELCTHVLCKPCNQRVRRAAKDNMRACVVRELVDGRFLV